jgi:type IV secretory pathway TraG/TraD family ATPase VirD4
MLHPAEHSVFLGRAHYRHGLRVPLEEHVLVMAPPRTYKTAFLANVILRYPGPVLATTTKADICHLTSAVRSYQGPVHVFNPQHTGGVPSTFRWSPVDGCADPATPTPSPSPSPRKASKTAPSGPPKPATTCAATSTRPPWPDTTLSAANADVPQLGRCT